MSACPKMVAGLLDARAAAISAELAEARRLREEAETVLATLKTKAAGADREAQSIVRRGEGGSRALRRRRACWLSASRSRAAPRSAQDKIAQAETAAMSEIRQLAADAAAAAAERLIAARLDETRAAAMIETSIKSLGSKLN